MDDKVMIIAEAGVNHNGDLRLARILVDKAKDGGADYVKFQTFVAEKNISRFAPKAEYQNRNTGNQESQLDMVRKLQLSEQDHWDLLAYCAEKNIGFLSTPFDFDSITLLKRLGVTIGKIPSGELVNLPYLRKMASSFERLIISTGMATMEEVGQAIRILTTEGADPERMTVLHCNTEYPTPFEDVNLFAMVSIREKFGVKVGYSDHTLGIEIPVAAVALGASVIEKHFTLDKTQSGPDHAASLDPAELASMVRSIRNVERSLGDGVKKPSPSEQKNLAIVRKSIVAARHIKKGEVFTEESLGLKRPGTGLSPMEWDRVIGLNAPRDFEGDELIAL